MCDIRLPDEAANDEHPAAPWGHSMAAHRAFGWCSHCKDHGPAEEVVAWRARANREHEARQAALAASAANTDPVIDLAAKRDRPCPACGAEALTVVSVTVVEGRTRREVGGWAFCTACDAVPAACYCQPGDAPYLAVPAIEEESRG
ncbi:hypothetical protein [Streptomyces sp. NBC_00443]|uniref:hypothetical protein n=1 Tax=Streptomyces sp. NBC_00443 TaxID=2975743 RepID=UPI002E240EEE